MSETELAMREKEEEYARAIEEDRLRREERRRRRQEAVLHHAQARAAVLRRYQTIAFPLSLYSPLFFALALAVIRCVCSLPPSSYLCHG